MSLFANSRLMLTLCAEKLPQQKRIDVERSASMLYGLMHARYIITGGGLQRMLEKYQSSEFGCCPRMLCRNQPVLPVGLSDTPNQAGTNVFCPRCHEIYLPKSSAQGAIDGSFFGTTFAHLFLLIYTQYIPERCCTHVIIIVLLCNSNFAFDAVQPISR